MNGSLQCQNVPDTKQHPQHGCCLEGAAHVALGASNARGAASVESAPGITAKRPNDTLAFLLRSPDSRRGFLEEGGQPCGSSRQIGMYWSKKGKDLTILSNSGLRGIDRHTPLLKH